MDPYEFITFEEGWQILQNGITKLQNIVEGLPVPNFTSEEHIHLYTTVYYMCKNKVSGHYDQGLYDKYRETCEEYISSKVLPSLQQKKDGPLLRELLERWSKYKYLIKRLSSFFAPLDAHPKHDVPSLEEISFSCFSSLVYEEMNKEIMDAIHAVMELKLAGVEIDPIFVINTLDFFKKCYKWTKKEEEMNHTPPSKQINLISYDGVMFEVDYDVAVALMSHRSKEITTETTSVCKLGSEMMTMMIEYYKAKKHDRGMNYIIEVIDGHEFIDDDAQFTNVDPKTLLDYTTCACYMKIYTLAELTWRKVEDLIKGKTTEQIAEIFS
ncbi:cullin-1-like isoform X2 [Trifolium pratense]|nr:cullin-1-like isoform X2 [Trifolium pratense]XP_045815133.1 cullin-1-like isoform X2 [Trifolium pratense]XP_045815134.1 cullin-1-like isoform X2 [Trifolium pratense]XP_045815135.1 cullin-1-like isoform X2 [Trifolium pratense]XP_045815136.1 cullin-1-like isoform X2 [Trifolium pratense]XP_045815139.1 cullin-1-like isoform X2 [Trifolium pratense]XP_045815140.1 cullin-1-like isoform X2 [Trifolium pratense]